MKFRCPYCTAWMPAEIWDKNKFQTAQVAPPWPAKVQLRTTHCTNCKHEICMTFRSVYQQPCVWAPRFEGKNYIAANKNLQPNQTSRILQGWPTSIVWCWHPMHDCTGYLGQIRAQVKRIIQERNAVGEAVMVVQPEEMGRFSARGADQWWLVKKEGMRDTFDPYPSVLVERNLLQSKRVRHIYHFSPAAFLPREDCIQIGNPAEMSKQWTIVRRSPVKVQVIKEMS